MRAASAAVAAATLVLGLVAATPLTRAAAAPLNDVGAATGPVAVEAGAAGGPGRLIVAFDDTARPVSRQAVHRRAGAVAVQRLSGIDADVVSVTDVVAATAAYSARGDVRYVEPDHTVRALAVPNDPGYDRQWNLHEAGPANPASLNWEPVWSSRAALGGGVRVAVIDSGFREGGEDDQEDEPVNLRMDLGRDFIRGDFYPDDEHGHGTHVIGTIAQATNNAKGVAGVAPDATVIPIKVLNQEGAGPVSAAIRGVQHAVDRKADVINLSLGGPYSQAFCEAVVAATSTAVVVVASGNESTAGGWLPVSWPASCPGVISVGALARDGTRAPYSNAGCTLSVAAPGGHPHQRRPDGSPYSILQESFDRSGFGYFYDSGTSMAAAHVSGAAAVLLAQTPRPSVAAVRDAIVHTARDVGVHGLDPATGAGAGDLKAALDGLANGTISGPAPRTGYWQVAADGGIFAFGDATFHGSTGGLRLNKPIVAMAPTPTGGGYWLVASDGGIFAFGDATFHGSTGGLRLNKPIVAMAPNPTGGGYWLVASDGGIFAFGNAGYQGSTGGIALNKPITAMAVTLSGTGYWLVASDGGIFAFGDAGYHGSTGNLALNSPIIGMSTTCRSGGYWLVAADGGMFSFGDAPFLGSTGGMALSKPVVGMAVAIDMG